MRLVLGFLLVLALARPVLAADGVEFVRVWPAWRDADAFDSISEYFTGREEHGHRIVLRTSPATRAGFYYLVRVKNSGAAVAGAKFSLTVIAPTSPDPKTYRFDVALRPGTSVYQLGLTGSEWPDRKAHPVAWRLELLAADGRILAKEQSFLWAMPEK